MSVPSRELIDSVGKSTASMVRRIRTVGGCCAQAADPSRVTKASEAAGKRRPEEEFRHGILPRCIWPPTQLKPRAGVPIPRRRFSLLPLWEKVARTQSVPDEGFLSAETTPPPPPPSLPPPPPPPHPRQQESGHA